MMVLILFTAAVYSKVWSTMRILCFSSARSDELQSGLIGMGKGLFNEDMFPMGKEVFGDRMMRFNRGGNGHRIEVRSFEKLFVIRQ